MKAQEKEEIIEVLEKLIKYIEEHLEDSGIYLCKMKDFIGVLFCNRLQKCGFNDRMIPQAIEHLRHQRPTKKMNKVIYEKPCFEKENILVFWLYGKHPDSMINTEKIDFLKHLINKLKN